ncbi:MAG: hypothetical protein KIT18_15755 [Burkholderiales bacterium]|nr:hypothetical protein [Burkholderiales bacterium]
MEQLIDMAEDALVDELDQDVPYRVLAAEKARICNALGHFATHAPLDVMSPRDIQRSLFAICGSPHVHVRSIGSDQCDLCLRDLRHEVHIREAV